jgi:hypothetical protein
MTNHLRTLLGAIGLGLLAIAAADCSSSDSSGGDDNAEAGGSTSAAGAGGSAGASDAGTAGTSTGGGGSAGKGGAGSPGAGGTTGSGGATGTGGALGNGDGGVNPKTGPVNVLWIGNSLTQAPLCGEGWLAVMFMCNDNKAETGVTLASQPVMMGATTLETHWANSDGFAEMDAPVAKDPADPWQPSVRVAKYDYIVLQPYHIGNTASDSSEEAALRKYADKALGKGIRPVIFGLWVDPTGYAGTLAMYQRVWNDYKSRGMLYAPLAEAYKSVVDDKGAAWLFGTDLYQHENEKGTYINMSEFYFLFTGYRPSAYLFANMVNGQCKEAANVSADKDYLAGKAEQALSLYYKLN